MCLPLDELFNQISEFEQHLYLNFWSRKIQFNISLLISKACYLEGRIKTFHFLLLNVAKIAIRLHFIFISFAADEMVCYSSERFHDSSIMYSLC